MPRGVLFLFGIGALLLAGCVSVQEMRDSRIGVHQALFNSFPAEVQDKVRLGQIDIGFTQEMVRLAWGSPDQVFTRMLKDQEVTIWNYTRTRVYPHSEWMSVPVHYVDGVGQMRTHYRSVWINWDTREEYTVARIEFTQGRVSAIEQLNP